MKINHSSRECLTRFSRTFTEVEDHNPEKNYHPALESMEGRPSVPGKTARDHGAFFQVVYPKGFGPIHLARLVITGLVEGTLDSEEYVLVLYDLIEKCLQTALAKRDFRKKWKVLLRALVALSKILPRIRNSEMSKAMLKYLILNRLGQHLNVIKVLIPPKNRDDSPLERIQIIRHQKYTPPVKKSTKVPSNSQGTKGDYAPDSIGWKEVASQEVIFINGKWEKSFPVTHPSEISEVIR